MLGGPLRAQSATVILGRVLSTGETPVAGAAIRSLRGGPALVSDSLGRFRLAPVAPGRERIEVRALGYRALVHEVPVGSGEDTVRVVIRLLPSLAELAVVRADVGDAQRAAFAARPTIAEARLSAREAASVPRLGDVDIVRAVQLLPGANARHDFTTSLNVRGGESDQNLVRLDGYPVYNPFHLAGLFSTFIESMVTEATLLTGPLPAQYGGRLSSVLDVRSGDEPRGGVHGRADLSVLSATAQLGGGANAGRSGWAVAARRTFADQVVALAGNDQLPYRFSDVHAFGRHAFTNNVQLTVTAYNGADRWDPDFSTASLVDPNRTRAADGRLLLAWGNRVLGATLSGTTNRARRVLGVPLPPNLTWQQQLSRSSFGAEFDAGDGSLRSTSQLSDVRLAGSATMPVHQHELSAGYEISRIATARDEVRADAGGVAVGETQFVVPAATYAEVLWRLGSRWRVQTGVRGEGISNGAGAAISPRVAVKLLLTPTVALTAASGRTLQFLHSVVDEDAPLRLIDSWRASDSTLPVSSVRQHSVGVEALGGAGRSLRLEGYVKHYTSLVERELVPAAGPLGERYRPINGTSSGVDLLLRQDGAGPVSGWIAYSYAINYRDDDVLRWSPAQDRRHALNLVGSWRRGRTTLGARFGFATGLPHTAIVGEVPRRTFDAPRNGWGTDGSSSTEYLGGPRNTARLPATRRLDLSLSRVYVRGRYRISPYLSVVNAYNARNVWLYSYDFATDTPERRPISQLPVIPSIGASLAF